MSYLGFHDRSVEGAALEPRPVWCDEAAPIPAGIALLISAMAIVAVTLALW